MNDHEERRQSLRRQEDLERKYSELYEKITALQISVESVRAQQNAAANLVQTNTLRLQDKQVVIESKVDEVKRIFEAKSEEIEELSALANRVKGSLATLNWIGIGTFVMALMVFIRTFMKTP